MTPNRTTPPYRVGTILKGSITGPWMECGLTLQ